MEDSFCRTKSGNPRRLPPNIISSFSRKNNRCSFSKGLKTEHVFCDDPGKSFQEVKRSFASACKRAGILGFRFHDLRHTFASHYAMRGGSIKALQKTLGHKDISMTMRY